jgi:hypothetical protein
MASYRGGGKGRGEKKRGAWGWEMDGVERGRKRDKAVGVDNVKAWNAPTRANVKHGKAT